MKYITTTLNHILSKSIFTLAAILLLANTSKSQTATFNTISNITYCGYLCGCASFTISASVNNSNPNCTYNFILHGGYNNLSPGLNPGVVVTSVSSNIPAFNYDVNDAIRPQDFYPSYYIETTITCNGVTETIYSNVFTVQQITTPANPIIKLDGVTLSTTSILTACKGGKMFQLNSGLSLNTNAIFYELRLDNPTTGQIVTNVLYDDMQGGNISLYNLIQPITGNLGSMANRYRMLYLKAVAYGCSNNTIRTYTIKLLVNCMTPIKTK